MVSKWVSCMTQGSNEPGHSLAEVIMYDDYQWDTEHDFIQWLFPNKTPSQFNPSAPLLTADDIGQFNANQLLQTHCRMAIVRFMRFLGIAYETGAFRRAYNFNRNCRYWLCPMSHNHQRITRLIHFCVAVGRQPLAVELLEFLLSELSAIKHPPQVSIEYWKRACVGHV